jgi:hypothetical protein
MTLQLVVEKEARQAAFRFHCSNHLKKSDWRHSAIFKMATEDFLVLLAPSIWWNIPLGRYCYLKLKHDFLPIA